MAVPRKEGRGKVTGQVQYIDDMSLPGMLYGATVRSRIPRGKITAITFGSGIPWDEFVVVSAKDIPGQNCVALIVDVWTGEIKAMAVQPTFDPNEYSKFEVGSWRNRSVTDVYEPGSIFKAITAAVALETGAIDLK